MTATRADNRHYPHEYSAFGPRISDSNKVFKTRNVAIPWRIPLTDTPNMTRSALPTTFNGTIVRDDPVKGGVWDDSATAGSKFTDDLTDILDAGSADFLFMPATEATPDKFVLGWAAANGVPVGINVSISTAGVGGTGAWKYLARDGTWKAFAKIIDLTTSLTAGTSNYNVLWQIPDDWVPMIESEIDTTAAYWYLAFEVATVYSTNPAGTEVTAIVLSGENISLGMVAPATGIIDYLQYKATASAANNDTIIQIYNWTRHTRGIATLTKAVAQARVALSTPLYVERGDELSIGLVQGDGTTEFVDFDDFTFEIQI